MPDMGEVASPSYIIISDFKDDEDGFLYWSNEDGWGSRETATVFSQEERDTNELPMQARAWIASDEPFPGYNQAARAGLPDTESPYADEKCPVCGQDDNCGDCNHYGTPHYDPSPWDLYPDGDPNRGEPTDDDIYNGPGVEGGIVHGPDDEPGSRGEHDPRL